MQQFGLNGVFIGETELRELSDDVVQVVRIRIASSVLRGPELGLVRDRIVPDDDVRGPGSSPGRDGEGQALIKGRFEQPQDSPAFFCVRQKGRSGKSDREKRFSGLGMPDALNAILKKMRFSITIKVGDKISRMNC